MLRRQGFASQQIPISIDAFSFSSEDYHQYRYYNEGYSGV
jgi:hypothetical protein